MNPDSFEAIKAAVRSGKTVWWHGPGYRVVFDGEWYIKCDWNDHVMSLFWRDGVRSDYKPADFRVAETEVATEATP